MSMYLFNHHIINYHIINHHIITSLHHHIITSSHSLIKNIFSLLPYHQNDVLHLE